MDYELTEKNWATKIDNLEFALEHTNDLADFKFLI